MNFFVNFETIVYSNFLCTLLFHYYSYQFFGSSTGFTRVYPGRPWQRNVIGFREDFDPRFRPWFVGATSGPKDVVIIVDTSRSMGDFFNAR